MSRAAIEADIREPNDFYSPELEAQDPIFDRATQAEIRRRIMETPPEQCIPFDPNDPESRARVLGEDVSAVNA